MTEPFKIHKPDNTPCEHEQAGGPSCVNEKHYRAPTYDDWMEHTRTCEFAAELFKKTGIDQTGHDFRCTGCAVSGRKKAEARADLLRAALDHTLSHALKFSVSMRDHEVVKRALAAEPEGLTELEAARAAVRGVGKLRQQLASTETSRKLLFDVLIALAPHVAAHARNPLVSPDGRADLLRIEPLMLDALQRQPKDPL